MGDDRVCNYIGIRADEDREGYISHKPNITPVYPFKEDGITRADVQRILDAAGLGLPAYYKWRSRSGCYFCFFQQKIEWVGLLENHPDLFEEAKAYERAGPEGLGRYTWRQNESLEELSRPERIAQIKPDHAKRIARERARQPHRTLVEILADFQEFEREKPCLICQL